MSRSFLKAKLAIRYIDRYPIANFGRGFWDYGC
jgi:hypothetical protein